MPQHIIHIPVLRFEDSDIKCVDSFNFVGITNDKHVNWVAHSGVSRTGLRGGFQKSQMVKVSASRDVTLLAEDAKPIRLLCTLTSFNSAEYSLYSGLNKTKS